jgi:hypothetical protein
MRLDDRRIHRGFSKSVLRVFVVDRFSEVTMQFEVNGQNYFLHFSDEEKQWVLFRPVGDDVEQVEIEDDTAQSKLLGGIIPFGSDRGTIN